jgi:hypothetical protein
MMPVKRPYLAIWEENRPVRFEIFSVTINLSLEYREKSEAGRMTRSARVAVFALLEFAS